MNAYVSRAMLAVAALATLATVGLFATGVGASPGSWSATGSMFTPRTIHTATRLADGRVLAAGGATVGSGATGAAEVYDPATGTWSPAASMNLGRSRHVALLLANGKVLIVGGRLANGAHTATAELYDPTTNTWTLTASMSVARDNFTGTLLDDGRVLVTGGVGGDGSGTVIEKSAEIYDPVVGQWAAAGKMAVRRFTHAAVRLGDGQVLVAGGAGPAGECVYFTTAEIYSPSTGHWRLADPMAIPRGFPALALLPHGRALAAGGLTMPADCVPSGPTDTKTAELYDAKADQWSPTDSIATSRRAFGDTQLADGSVLLAGGRSSTDTPPLSTAELYDPTTGIWAPAGAMTTPRVAFRLTTLTDGKVLATGGAAGPSLLLNSAELYTP